MEPALKAAGVRKTYSDVVALDGVDLQLAPGEIVGLLGPNGAGKTTLVSIVAGLRRPDAGSVSVCGIDVLARPDAVFSVSLVGAWQVALLAIHPAHAAATILNRCSHAL